MKKISRYSFCLECGKSYYPIEYGAKFCGSCGKQLSTHCPNPKCNHEINIPDKHCVCCGQQMIKNSSGCATFKVNL